MVLTVTPVYGDEKAELKTKKDKLSCALRDIGSNMKNLKSMSINLTKV
jgi:hypothetical protein